MTDAVQVNRRPCCPVCHQPSHSGTPEWPMNLASAPAPPDRYCEICGDTATYADLSTYRTIHRNRVCALWTLEVRIDQLAIGDIISSYRLMNYYSPMRISSLGEIGPDRKLAVGLQTGRWEFNAAASLVLTFSDTSPAPNYFYHHDLVARADPGILGRSFTVEQVPAHWLEIHHGWRSGAVV